jgi:hypothetical protein
MRFYNFPAVCTFDVNNSNFRKSVAYLGPGGLYVEVEPRFPCILTSIFLNKKKEIILVGFFC